MRKLRAREKKWIEKTVNNDRSYKAFLYNRFFVFLLSALFQLLAFILLIHALVYNSAVAIGMQLAFYILEIVFVLYVINKNERPSLKLGWILLIVLVPAFGVPMYLFNGEGRPTVRMQKRIQKAQNRNEQAIQNFYAECGRDLTSFDEQDAVSYYLEKHGKYPVYTDGDVTYYKSGEDAFLQMLDALKNAERYILVEYFIIAHGKMWNEILKILLEKASLGVQVRIIYDDFGCMVTLPPKYERYLESLHENIRCMTFNDVVPFFEVRMNNRDHRKILVIDGKVAFTGGINLADEYIGEKRRFGYWKDSCVKVTGSSIAEFIKMFFYIWNAFRLDKEDVNAYLPTPKPFQKPTQEQDFRVQPYDDSPLDRQTVAETVYVDIIDRAKKYVWFFTPYLILDDHVRLSLCKAALRGVDVRIVTPGIPDKKITYRLTRANYKILIKSGVRIYEYTPGFIHSKNVVSDDICAVVGTINLDYRSLYHHFENAVYFTGCQAVQDVKRDFEETFTLSKECSLTYPKRSLIGRLFDSVLRVFETLL